MQTCLPDRSRENPALDLRALTRLRSQHPSVSESAQKIYNFLFGPITVVWASITVSCFGSQAGGLPDKRTVPAVCRLDEGDVRVRTKLLPGLGRDANERIIRSVQDQSGHCDLPHHVRRRGAVIIIVDAGEAAIVGGYFVIEFAQAPNAAQAAGVEVFGKQSRLLHHAAA